MDRVIAVDQAIRSLHAAIDCLRYEARDEEGKELLAQRALEITAAEDRLRAFKRYELYPKAHYEPV